MEENGQTNFKHTRLLSTLDSPRGSNIQNESQGNSGNVPYAAPSGQPSAATLFPEEDLPSITERPRFDKITKQEARNQPFQECKIVFLGAPQVGKSSIIRRFIDGEYAENAFTSSTILEKKLAFCRRIQDNKIFKVVVYDIGEDMEAVEAGVFDQCQVAIIVFDVTEDRTVKVAKQVMLKVKAKVGNYPTKFLLAGNKCDLIQHHGVNNTIRRGRTLANDKDIPCYEMSAKQEGDKEIDKLFEKAVEKAIEAEAQSKEQNRNNHGCVLL